MTVFPFLYKNVTYEHTQAVVISFTHCLMFPRIGFRRVNAVMELDGCL